jgi:acyl-CoA synthetase (NDP forming)
MINSSLINPKSIAVVGASTHLDKPGGRMIYNLKEYGFKGPIYPVNSKEQEVCGLKAFNSIQELPETDMAVLAVSPQVCVETAEYLVNEKSTKALIVVAAGFSETGNEGKLLEERLRNLAIEKNVSILGPNCMGIINQYMKAVFVSPPPDIHPGGVDFVTASGALAVFILDLSARMGLRFGSIFSVGNSSTNGVEEVLEYWDESFNAQTSGMVKMVYVEQIRKPEKFFRHIRSLKRKGCTTIVLKPGDSQAGARAALSHTGAFAGDSKAYFLLIEKAGAVRCYSREEMVYLACVLSQKPLKGKNIAVVTQAGGPAVLLSDTLEKAGLKVPEFDKNTREYFASILMAGSSTHNPVDMLSTAHREQLAMVLEHCDKLEYIDGIAVIYGKTGMENLFETFAVLNHCTIKCKKPVYSVLPSVGTGEAEISQFVSDSGIAYADEVVLGQAIGKVANQTKHISSDLFFPKLEVTVNREKKILLETEVLERIKTAGIPVAKSIVITNLNEVKDAINLGFPLVAKVTGILHKTEVGGVMLNINSKTGLEAAVSKFLAIEGSTGVFVQEMLLGTEIYIGGKRHLGVGYSVHAGLGGIFVELLADVASCLAPINFDEARQMLKSLKAQKIFKGFRNLPAVDFNVFAQTIVTFSKIFELYPDIDEIDLNPLIANGKSIVAVDARIITD